MTSLPQILPPIFYDIEVLDIYKKQVTLKPFKNMAILVVNVASKCGYTNQYEDLQKLYETYKDKGFTVLGFTSNQFEQELESEEKIQEFLCRRFKVDFPMFAIIEVNGKNASPIFKLLKGEELDKNSDKKSEDNKHKGIPKDYQPGKYYKGDITWNFEKFLINKNGEVIGRYISKDLPDANSIELALNPPIKQQNEESK